MAYLELHTPGGVQRVVLKGTKTTLGRHEKNRVRVNDDQVSRFHCELERMPDGLILRDLGSRNGTWMDKQRVAEVLVKPGDQFQIGGTRIVLRDGTPPDGQARGKGKDQGEAAAPAPTSRPADGRPSSRRGAAAGGAEPASAAKPAGDSALDLIEQIKADAESQPEADDPLGALAVGGEGDPFTVAEDEPSALMTARSDFGTGSLEALTKVGRDLPYDASHVALINARGSIVHAPDKEESATAETIRMLRQLLLACTRTGASDLHLEPQQDVGVVRLRVDGAMVEALRITGALAKRLHSLVKVLADIDIAKKALVQEGHFSAQMPDRRVDYRVSFTPAMYGQKLVLRVLDPFNAPQQLRDLGLPEWMYRSIRSVSRQDSGMLLICGPTGSGKTTTLYAVLRQIDARQRNVVTIEDPPEYQIAGTTQIPVDESQGNTFHTLLRSVLRQDPDVIVLGEIRDKETATTAMQAATTGHLVLSTIHAKDTIGTIFRLLDLGVEPYLVATTLNLILAQRLARELCPHCKVGRKPTPSQTMRLGRQVEGVQQIYTPGACARCFGTGYSGRRAIFELLTTKDEIRDVILKNPNIGALRKAIEMIMFTSLRDSGMDLVRKGITSMEEIDRVIGIE